MAAETVQIPFGRGHLPFKAPRGVKLEVLRSKPKKGLRDPDAALAAAVARPLSARPLAEVAAGARSACIVVSDITRPVPNALILGRILPVIEGAGVAREAITILIGTGTHRAAPPAEIAEIVGARVARKYRVVNHDCRRGNTRIGAVTNPLTGAEIPILLDRRYVNADLRIVTGLVEPHIFCGYSGGRKALLPGIAALTSIRRWHGPELIAHPNSAPGVTRGNLPAALALDAARQAGCDFAVNVTLNRDRQVTGVFAGDVEAVYDGAVGFVESYVLTEPVAPAKVIVTSAAGRPLDATFYQAIKGLIAVLPIMAEGGVAVLAAEASEGIGDAGFTRLVRRTRDVVEWSANLAGRRGFSMGQWQLQRMAWVRARGAVYLVSRLDDADARAAFSQPFGTLQAAVDAAVAHTGAGRIVAVPEGPYVVTRPAN